ncbi:DUF1987 domain-containing protein [Mangrovivirga cuniculi]|nr:DUF1987 domain-containing protein [Mangrovivirga cuniculi]
MMLDLNILPSQRTPLIDYKLENNKITISGRSIPENAIDFFNPLFKWADSFCSDPNRNKLSIDINLDYFNTSSSKCLIEFFRKMERCSKKGKEVIVNWIYDSQDESMYETGEDFMQIINLPFNMKSI